MKKIFSIFTLCMLISAPIFAKTEIMSINGKDVSVNTEEINGRKLIPLRQVADELKLITNFQTKSEYYWGKDVITIATPDYSDNISLVIGSNYYYHHGSPIELDAPPTIINGSTYVPLRLICEVFNKQINLVNGKVVVTSEQKQGSTNDSTSTNTDVGNMKTVNGIQILTDGKVDKYEFFYNTAKSVVRTNLKDRNSAKFDIDNIVFVTLDDNGKDVFVSGEVRATNSYGAYVTSSYDVMFTEGNWQKFTLWMDGKLVSSNQI